jgi:hypothetical protein
MTEHTWDILHATSTVMWATLVAACALRWRLRRGWPLAVLTVGAALELAASVLTWFLTSASAAAWYRLLACCAVSVAGLAIIVKWIREQAPDAENSA